MIQQTALPNEKKKVAVVLFNLGGPTGVKTIYPFLVNFFMDPNIIPVPKFFRFFLSRMIAIRRSKGPALEAYSVMGGKSPLLENTLAQQDALYKQLLEKYDSETTELRVYTCMRYWHPMADSVVSQVQSFNPDELVLLSLYPQMSSTTFWSSLGDWLNVCKKFGYKKMPRVVCCYPQANGFIKASAENIREKIQLCVKETGRMPRVLFSAHSLPLSVIKNGDPYEYQCKLTTEAIVKELNLPDLDYRTTYQSKVGPQEWLGPQTEDEIKIAAHENLPLIIYPHAFVSEHVETIVELGVEYRHVAEGLNIPYYDVVPTVGTHPLFIRELADLVVAQSGQTGVYSDCKEVNGMCPEEFGWCCKRRSKADDIFCVLDKADDAQSSCCKTSCGCK